MLIEKKIFLTTPRLVICVPEVSDLTEQFLLQSSPEVMRYIGNGVRGINEVKKKLQACITHYLKHGFSLGNVYNTQTGEFIGRSGIIYLGLDDSQCEIELAYALLPQYWGQGYATELAQNCAQWAFENIPIERILGLVRNDNLASQAVLKKIGMHYVDHTYYNDFKVNKYCLERSP